MKELILAITAIIWAVFKLACGIICIILATKLSKSGNFSEATLYLCFALLLK